MKNIFEAFQVAHAMATKEAELVQETFKGLTLEQKLELALSDDGHYLDKILKYECYYSGSTAGADVSLYDDFYWDRNETKQLSDIVERTVDGLPFTQDESLADYIKLILEAAEAGEAKSSVLVDMLNQNIGSACHDW